MRPLLLAFLASVLLACGNESEFEEPAIDIDFTYLDKYNWMHLDSFQLEDGRFYADTTLYNFVTGDSVIIETQTSMIRQYLGFGGEIGYKVIQTNYVDTTEYELKIAENKILFAVEETTIYPDNEIRVEKRFNTAYVIALTENMLLIDGRNGRQKFEPVLK